MKRFLVIWVNPRTGEQTQRTCYDKRGANQYAEQKRREGYKVTIQ